MNTPLEAAQKRYLTEDGHPRWWRIGATLAAVLLVITLGSVALGWISLGFRSATSGVRADLESEVQTNTGENQVARVTEFNDRCGQIQALHDQRVAQEALLGATREEGGDTSRVLTRIAGVQGAIAEATARYNADVNNEYQGRFLPDDLPTDLSADVRPEC